MRRDYSDRQNRWRNQQQTDSQTANILLRLQAKQVRGDLFRAVAVKSSKISIQARELPPTTNTCITTEIITRRNCSWQSHLQRISPYLLPGKGVWWQTTPNGYEFFDGDDAPDTRLEGPALHHFRNTALQDIYKRKSEVWKQLLDNNTILPAPFVKLYDTHGKNIGRRYYNSDSVTTTMDMSPEETTAPSEGILNMEATLSRVEDMDHITTVEEPMEVSITVDGQYTTQSDNQDCQKAGQHCIRN